jgi:hypothetical protein
VNFEAIITRYADNCVNEDNARGFYNELLRAGPAGDAVMRGMTWDMLDHEAQEIVLTIENDQVRRQNFVSTYSYNGVSCAIADALSHPHSRFKLGTAGYYGTSTIAWATPNSDSLSLTQRNLAFRWLLHSILGYPLERAFPEHYDALAVGNAIHERFAALNSTTVLDAFLPPQPKEFPMNTIAIETRTYVNGADISSLTDDQVFATIASAEAAVKKLEAIEAKPAKLQAKIDALKASILKLGELVDAR